MNQANNEVTGLMMRGEEKEVLEDITITPKGIPLGEHTIFQVHPMSGSIRGGLGWIHYRGK
jgi:hypothetical protein